MNKLHGILKLNFIKVFKNKLFIVAIILSLLGTMEILRNTFKFSPHASYLTFIQSTAITLLFVNFSIIFPVINLGKEEQAIFKCMNIKTIESLLGKLITVFLLDLIYCSIIVLLFLGIGYSTNMTISESLYYIKKIITYEVIYLLFYNSIGLFLSKILGNKLNGFFAYIIAIAIVFFTSGFAKTEPNIISPCNMSMLPSLLSPIKINDFFYLNVKFWIAIVSAIVLIYIISELKISNYKLRYLLIAISLLSFIIIAKIGVEYKEKMPSRLNYMYNVGYRDYLNNQIVTSQPQAAVEQAKSQGEEIEVIPKTDKTIIGEDKYVDILLPNDNITNNEYVQNILQLRDKVPYKIAEYNMEIDLQEKFKNDCRIKMIRDNLDIKEIKLDFYNKNKIDVLKVNDREVEYKQDNTALYITIPEEIKSEELELRISYSSYIYTYYGNFQESDFVTDNSGFLSGGLAWYPKLMNDDYEYYTVKVKCKSNNIYTNMDMVNDNGYYEINGKEKNLVLLYGRLSEYKVDKYTIIAPTEIIKNEKSLNMLIDNIRILEEEYDGQKIYEEFTKVFVTPVNVYNNERQYGDLILYDANY